MTQKEKQLLLVDLCGRLPYYPLVEYKGETYNVLGITHGRLVLCKPFMSYTLDEHPLVEEVKPYLFSISSMTKEQMEELEELCDMYTPDDDCHPYAYNGIKVLCKHVLDDGYKFNFKTDVIEFFHKNHIDYRGLIPMGLANDAAQISMFIKVY